MSSHPFMVNPRHLVRPIVFAFLLSALSAASVSMAYGQFTLTSQAGLSPSSVDPGGSAIANIDLGGSSGAVSFNTIPCTVTPQPTDAPQCSVSPDSATPPAMPSLTVTTKGTTPPGLYSIVVTGTSGSTSVILTLTLNVVNITEDYTLSVLPATATPSPVTAGNVATTTVTVTPIGSYSGHQVTLACLSVSPIVAGAPVCSFNPATVSVTSSSIPPTSTLTITTFGTVATTRRIPRMFYALWLPIPGLALVGAAGARKRRERLRGLLLLTGVAIGLLLIPACSSSNHTNNPTGQITPKNTYTFTLTGADELGAAPSNTTTSAAIVTLAVN